MVGFGELRGATPASWQAAADDMLAAAKEAEQAAAAIHANGASKLADSWPDELGQMVRADLIAVTQKLDTMGVLLRGATTAMDTLENAARLAQKELTVALDYAASVGIGVDEKGTATILPEFEDDPLSAQRLRDVSAMIGDALDAATGADDEGVSALGRLAVDPDIISTDDARKRQAQANQDALDMIRDALPDGQSPKAVRRWWDALTPEERTQFKRAVPVELAGLDGIPKDVVDGLRGNRGYDALEMVRYAKEHWDDQSIDIFDNNCANFVSNALLGAGLDEKGTFTTDDDGWGRSKAGDWGWDLDWPGPGSLEGLSHTDSWTYAEAQKNFLLDNGGEDVGVANARPGDVVYWEHANSGEAHHAAVVTAVLPNGEVLYTQHSPSAQNLSLQGRLPMGEQAEGDQNVFVVRPKQSW
ncbi:amidase domain-containing protein [Aldersonia sp. NBC_00410]|uniref:amidase domain-containing protein n=1 Tax=Aldersonia sp. NBC_00410 TaxID=2975954 RepID=UPI0022582934|nr:amidase domain-containing protein [Aldersonia sp. NBC_00410]MCX5042118.1 amidase domain-containing protein [Aldersonia sp. NBC_00410]